MYFEFCVWKLTRAGQKHNHNPQTLLSHRQARGLWLYGKCNSSVPICSPWRQNIITAQRKDLNTGRWLQIMCGGTPVVFRCPEKSPLSIYRCLSWPFSWKNPLSSTPLTCFQDRTLNKLSHICFVQLVQHVVLCSHEFWSYSDVQ